MRHPHRRPPDGWNFRNHVIPVLTKAGCNQGACHGALAGKGGFKLTLRGYDPELDYDMLTRQSVGRRITLAEPGASLILRKPTMQTAARRRPAIQAEFAGIPDHRGMDRRGNASSVAEGQGSCRRSKLSRSRQHSPSARRQQLKVIARLLRRQHGGRHALGEVQLQQRRRRNRRRQRPRQDQRIGRGRRHALVLQPRSLRDDDVAVSEPGSRRKLTRSSRARTTSTISCSRS